MPTGLFCGVTPIFFRKKSLVKSRSEKNKYASKNGRSIKASIVQSSSGGASNFVTMTDLRNKLSSFRDVLDLACPVSASITELLILTLSDLFKRYPKIKPMSELKGPKGPSLHKALRIFCDTLKSLGDLWTTEKWMVKCKYTSFKKLGHVEIEQTALALLDDIIKLARERLFEEMGDDSAFAKALSESSDNRTSFSSSSPVTPTSVLSISCKSSSGREKISYSPPLLLPLRAQAVGKLNPIDLKRLSFHMFPHVVALAQDPKYAILLNNTEMEEQLSETRPSNVSKENLDDEVKGEIEMNNEDNPESEMKCGSPRIARTGSVGKIGNSGRKCIDVQPQPTLEASDKQEMDVCLSPPPPSPPPPMAPRNLAAAPPPPPPPPPPLPVTSGNTASPPPQPPPPPPPMALMNCTPPPMATSALIPTAPPSPPSPMSISKRTQMAPPPPPPPSKGNGATPLPPPPPMGVSKGYGAVPPPPPGVLCLRPKKVATKLKRSSHIGNLYRVLKGKVEGSSLEGKSSGRKGSIGGGGGGGAGKQGMADALAEMTKRSAYFIQIGEDVKTYAEAIKVLKAAISSFQTTDMTELLEFHKYVESHLEQLTDETQVLARFEDFPSRKLEALRMAAALYSKLDSIVTTLQNFPRVGPVCKLLDKAENYFNKIKVELDALERTKDDEAKRFQAQKITFDFGILLRIKEVMVDVSSNCMELALEEKKEAMDQENNEENLEKKKKASAKMLWRAFQFAFRVYTFAGGHDERADKLTRELALEIEIWN